MWDPNNVFFKREYRSAAAPTVNHKLFATRVASNIFLGLNFAFPTLAAPNVHCSSTQGRLSNLHRSHKGMTELSPGWLIIAAQTSIIFTLLLVEYIPNDNELLESENLELVGEDPGNGSLRTGTVPVRILTGFSVFDIENRRLVTPRSLMVPRDSPHLSSYCAVGYVLPATEDAVDDAEETPDPPGLEDCQYIRLSAIRSMSVLGFDDEHKELDR